MVKTANHCCHPDGCSCTTEDGDAVCAFHAEVLEFQNRYVVVPKENGKWNGFHVDQYLSNHEAIVEQRRADYWSAPEVMRARARAYRERRRDYIRASESARKTVKAERRAARNKAKTVSARAQLICEDCQSPIRRAAMTGRRPRFCDRCAHERQLAWLRRHKQQQRQRAG